MTLNDYLSDAEVSKHLEQAYKIHVNGIEKLDLNVYKVSITDSPCWVARVFQRRLDDLQREADILRHLRNLDFPAERWAHENAVCPYNSETCVLVTLFAEGTHPERNRKTFHRLGHMLGQLHVLPALPAEMARTGGAWHHLSTLGGLREEVEAAQTGLTKYRSSVSPEKVPFIDRLIAQLDKIDLLEDLPLAILHPDFVSPNVIEDQSTGEWMIVDWAGVGMGPRILSLGYLLFVGAARGKLVLVDFVMKGYSQHVRLESEELNRLKTAIWARPFTIACWDVFHGRKEAGAAVEDVHEWVELADKVVNKMKELRQRGGRAES